MKRELKKIGTDTYFHPHSNICGSRYLPLFFDSIVIIRTDRIGEVLLATPVIEALKKHFSKAKISFVTSGYAKDVVSGRSDLEETIIFSTIDRKISLTEAAIFSFTLRRRKFGLAVILNPHKMLHLAAFLAGIPYRVGYNRKWGHLLTHAIEDTRDKGAMHEVQYNLALLEAIGVEEKGISPYMHVSYNESCYIKGLFEQFEITPENKKIILHPGSSNPAKMWPIKNFSELIKRLSSSKDVSIIAIGDASEKRLCAKMISDAGVNAVNLCGFLTIKQLAALLKEADLIITNDNGPMHIAASVGTKVIAIFGRNFPGVGPKRWRPYGEGHVVFHNDPGCSPCYDKDCPYDLKCLSSVTVDEVFQAAKFTNDVERQV